MDNLRAKMMVTAWIVVNLVNEKNFRSTDDAIIAAASPEFNNFGSTPLRYVACSSAMYLLIKNRFTWKTSWETIILIPYIGCTIPSFLYTIIRGTFGYWTTLVTVVLRLFFSNHVPEWTKLPTTFIMMLSIAPHFIAQILGSSLLGSLFCKNISIYLLNYHLSRPPGGFLEAFTRPYIFSTIAAAIMWSFTMLVYFEWI